MLLFVNDPAEVLSFLKGISDVIFLKSAMNGKIYPGRPINKLLTSHGKKAEDGVAGVLRQPH